MPKKLKDVNFIAGGAAKIWVEHPDTSREEVPEGQATTYDWVSGDTFEAKAGVSFVVSFEKEVVEFKKGEDGKKHRVKTIVDQEILVEDDPPAISIPDPSFFDLIEDYYDGSETTTTLQVGDDAVSIRG